MIFETKEHALDAVRKDGRRLLSIPAGLLDRDVYLAAVSQCGYMLRFVPEEMRDATMCLNAVMQDLDAVQAVPPALIAQALQAMQKASRPAVADGMPIRITTDAEALAVVTGRAWALRYVPVSLKTREVCMMAVRQKGLELVSVPDGLRDREMCELAVQNEGLSLMYVPAKLRDEKMCLYAVGSDVRAFQFVPTSLRQVVRAKLDAGQETDVSDQEAVRQV